MLGVGVDLVDLDAFATSLTEPGTRMSALFSATELRQVRERTAAHSDPAQTPDSAATARHLGACWAAKEAVIKAWSAARRGSPPLMAAEQLRWSEIEILGDVWGRPAIRVRGHVARAIEASLGAVSWHVSLSHDGAYAVAYVVAERASEPGGRS